MVQSSIRIYTWSDEYKHAKKRIIEAEQKAQKTAIAKGLSKEEEHQVFYNAMAARLKKIKTEDKIHYAIAVFKEKGYTDLVDLYESGLLFDAMKEFGSRSGF